MKKHNKNIKHSGTNTEMCFFLCAVLFLLTLLTLMWFYKPFTCNLKLSPLQLLPKWKYKMRNVNVITSSIYPCLCVHRISHVSMVDSVKSPGMTSSVTAPLTIQASYARCVYGVSTRLAWMECAVWIYKMDMNVSYH